MAMPSKDRKEIVETLKVIRESLLKEHRKRPHSQTFGDNMADQLTLGKGLLGSIKEAIKTESEKGADNLKKTLDPMNIVKHITGGSRLATVLAGKATGRSDDDIRAAAGFAQNKPKIAVPLPTGTSTGSPATLSPSQLDSGGATTLLEQMANSLGLILLRVTDIAKRLGAVKVPEVTKSGGIRDKETGKFMSGKEARSIEAQTKLLISIRDTLLDTQTLEKAYEDKRADAERVKKKEGATRVNSSGKPLLTPQQSLKSSVDPKEESGGFLSGLIGEFVNLKTVLLGFGAAVGTLFLPMDKLKEVLAGSLRGIETAYQSMRSVVKSVPESISTLVKSGGEAIKGVAEGAKNLASNAVTGTARAAGKLISPLLGKAPEAIAPATAAATTLAKEAAPKAAQAATKLIKPAESVAKVVAEKAPNLAKGSSGIKKFLEKEIPKKMGGTVGKMIPGLGAALGLGFAVSRLVKGDYVGATLEAVSGLGGAVTAIPALVATLIRDTYNDQYGIQPEEDPLAGERLPELSKIVGEEVDSWMKSSNDAKAPDANEIAAPTSVDTPPTSIQNKNTTGQAIAKTSSMIEDLKVIPSGQTSSPSTINVNNISNQQTNATLNSFPSPRSQESSYLRSVDSNSAH